MQPQCAFRFLPNEQDIHDMCTFRYTDRYFHTISGWYGISGSLIGCIIKEGSNEPEVKVVGLCMLTLLTRRFSAHH